MTVSVRPWAEISADLRRWNMVLTREAADWGDALAAGVAATLPTCPTCGGKGHGREHWDDDLGNVAFECPDCDHGKVTVAQMAAVWAAVHEAFWDDDQAAVRLPNNDLTATAKHLLAYLRSVRPVSPELQCSHGVALSDCPDRSAHHAYPPVAPSPKEGT